MKGHPLPLATGAGMGLAMPWLMHVDGAGVAFIAGHAALAGAALLLVRLAPRLLRRLHRPDPAHLGRMAAPAAAAWSATCLICLAIGGQHWS